MSNFLRQSTASQSRAIGPFLDDTDFKTAETGLTVANTDIKLIVNGGASADKNSGGGTHRANGVYGITFDATDTATVGELEVSVKVAGALPVFKTFVVIEEAVFDALYAASAAGYASAAQGTAIQAKTDNLPSDPADASVVAGLIAGVETKVDTVDTVVDAIKLKTDNLPSDPADASVVAGLIAGVEAKVDTVDTVVDAIKVTTDKLDDTLEDDGGTYRFTTNALEQAPSGGGGSADWTADERTAIRTILGIPGSGTTPADPTDGILDDIRDLAVAIDAKTTNLPSDPADASVIAGLIDPLPTNAELAIALAAADDAVLAAIAALPQDNTGCTLSAAYDFAKGTTAMTEAYAADGAAMTPVQALHMTWALLAERTIAATTLTAKKLDGSTAAMTFTLDSGTAPTTQTRAS